MDVLASLLVDFSTIQGWIAAGGYLVLFLLLFGCGLGLPLPEDIPLMIAGALAHAGHMDLAIAGACAWAGIMGGDVALYHLSKKYGMGVIQLPLLRRHVTQQRIERLEKLFERYGIWVVAIARLFAGVRGAMVIAAGITRYNFIKFFVADGLSALISGGLFMALGWWLHDKLKDSMSDIDQVKHWIMVAAIVLVVGGLGWYLWRRRRSLQRMERATAALGHGKPDATAGK
jgi:LPXTG-motif cell wall-anchored protein